ncbi:MAG: CHRD domain-containing protein, partial [Bacteroidota bacterium]
VRTGELRGQVTTPSATNFQAGLSGHQVRPHPTNTLGNGRMIVSTSGEGQVRISGSINDLQQLIPTGDSGAVRLHVGTAGTVGPIVFPLTVTVDDDRRGGLLHPADNVFDLSPEQLEALFNRELYINVSTDPHPEGMIRGQVMHPAKGYFGSNLAGNNVLPNAAKTTGQGFLMCELLDNVFTASGSFTYLSGTYATESSNEATVRMGSASEQGSPVFELRPLLATNLRAGTFQGSDNTFPIDATERAALLSGALFLDLPTSIFSNGELRGQLLRADNAFPSEPELMTPEDSIMLVVHEGNNDLLNITFGPATDRDDNQLVYSVEVTTGEDSSFVDPIICQQIGTDNFSAMAIKAAYDSLLANDAVVGTALPLRYRVLASDGSVATASPAQLITLATHNLPCEVEGGQLRLVSGGTTDTICIDDGTPDLLEVILTDTIAPAFTYLVVDEQGNILATPVDQPINFGGANPGQCTLYAVSHDGSLGGAMINSSIDDLEGCFSLSNSISIVRQAGDECTNDFTGITPAVHEGAAAIEHHSDGISEEAVHLLRVAPNPFGELLFLQVIGGGNLLTQIDIIDLQGRLVYNQQLRLSTGRYVLPRLTIPAGAYLLRLQNENGLSVTRIIKR